jgi:hypothetical protein
MCSCMPQYWLAWLIVSHIFGGMTAIKYFHLRALMRMTI